ncbi:Hypothetical DUF1295-domain-containing protein [Mycena indigotica]|uniref:Hypothetical DUF1295-domain-containing protein n=1 Tax=Mycena indigotica TaxID=2126181 RepID=A0A8H6WA94_9AGAR|nr:Hypothetical DUF1295-domain-containing protein [Mycena indigotica]KAF7307398.1 Hypothetical DUF1295-domain-containing protein [Mycena indigotica]
MPVYALDHFYLLVSLLVTVAYQLTGFAIAYTLQFDKITDLTGGSNFFILALLVLLLGGTYQTRNIIASVFVLVWAVRIASFLFYRVLKTGHDGRFDDIRKSFFKFLAFWIAQILWVWTVSLPVIILNAPAVSDVAHGGSSPKFGTARDIVGVVMWTLGFLVETIADAQKFRYKSSPSTSKDKPINAAQASGHGHATLNILATCLQDDMLVGHLDTVLIANHQRLATSAITCCTIRVNSFTDLHRCVRSPSLFVARCDRGCSILMFGSGMPTSTKPQAKRYYLKSYGPEAKPENSTIWAEYKEYLQRTSILIPLPPVIYAPLPAFIKRTLLFEFPMYQFDEATDGEAAVTEAKQNLI